LDNQVDPSTGTIKLKASFPNAGLKLWPGAFVTVRLRVATLHAAVVVPPVAVQRGPSGPYLFVIGADNLAARRNVAIAHDGIAETAIATGLKPGEAVVVDGASRLSDKARVTVLPPPKGGAAG
ncbi:MAG: efflux RND transporter periplasmic adaptor subunit, partial [Rhodospirillales bacterium]|nr:efflux RND transporter periplasmic adaptor subunit [Rhodospirillales bacterium]